MSSVLGTETRHNLAQLTASKSAFDGLIRRLEAAVPLDPLALPADSSSALLTRIQLEEHIEEYNKTADEAQALQVGDLDQLRAEAKAAAAKEMSQTDTDVVELALQTLFALDKGQMLLKQRSKALNLIDLRLKWQEQRYSVQKDAGVLKVDLVKFISKARWILPEDAVTRRRRISMQAKKAAPSAVQSPTSRKLNGLLATPNPPGSPLGGGSTSSVMARRMRLDILNLDLARNTQRLHSLQQVALASCGRTLDKLIDLSTIKLPDEFLDVQEALEDEISQLVDKTQPFLAAIVAQWKLADEIYWLSEEIDQEAESIEREVQAELVKRPNVDTAQTYLQQYCELASRLQGARRQVKEKLPMPLHTLSIDQDKANILLQTTLLNCLDKAHRTLEQIRKSIDSYSVAASAINRADTAKAALEASLPSFVVITEEFTRIGKELPEMDLSVLDTALNTKIGERIEELQTKLADEIQSVSAHTKTATQCLEELHQCRVDPNVRQDLRQMLKYARDAQQRCKSVAEDTEFRYERFRSVKYNIELMHKNFEELAGHHQRFVADFGIARWRPGSPSVQSTKDINAKVLDDFDNTGATREKLDGIELDPALSKRLSDFATRHDALAKQVQAASELCTAARRQAAEVSNVLQKGTDLCSEIQKDQAEASHTFEKADARIPDYSQRLQTLAAEAERLPFLGNAFDDFRNYTIPRMSDKLEFETSTNPANSTPASNPDVDVKQACNDIILQINSALAKLREATLRQDTVSLSKELESLSEALDIRTREIAASRCKCDEHDRQSVQYGQLRILAKQIEDLINREEPQRQQFCSSLAKVEGGIARLRQTREASVVAGADGLAAAAVDLRRIEAESLRDLEELQAQVIALNDRCFERLNSQSQALSAADDKLNNLKRLLDIWSSRLSSLERATSPASDNDSKKVFNLQNSLDAVLRFELNDSAESLRSTLVNISTSLSPFEDIASGSSKHRQLNKDLLTTRNEVDRLEALTISHKASAQPIIDRHREAKLQEHRAEILSVGHQALKLAEKECSSASQLFAKIVDYDDPQSLRNYRDRLQTQERSLAIIKDHLACAKSAKENALRTGITNDEADAAFGLRTQEVTRNFSDLQNKHEQELRELEAYQKKADAESAKKAAAIAAQSKAEEIHRQQEMLLQMHSQAEELDALSRTMAEGCDNLASDTSIPTDSTIVESFQSNAQELRSRLAGLQNAVENFAPTITSTADSSPLRQQIATSKSSLADINEFVATISQQVTKLEKSMSDRASSRLAIKQANAIRDLSDRADLLTAEIGRRLKASTLPSSDDADAYLRLLDDIDQQIDELSQNSPGRAISSELPNKSKTLRDSYLQLRLLSEFNARFQSEEQSLMQLLESAESPGDPDKHLSAPTSALQEQILLARETVATLLGETADLHYVALETERKHFAEVCYELLDHVQAILDQGGLETPQTPTPLPKSASSRSLLNAESFQADRSTRIPRPSLQAPSFPRPTSSLSVRSTATQRSVSGQPSRIRKLSGLPHRAPSAASSISRRSVSQSEAKSQPKPVYIPAKRKIDIAIGRIVNDLAAQGGSRVNMRAADDAFDSTGKYWIGERLYFCRILRDRTVMVRVGGGWRELRAFLQSHIAHANENGVGMTRASSSQNSLSASLSRSVSGEAIARTLSASYRRSASPFGEESIADDQELLLMLHEDTVKQSPTITSRWH